MIKFSSQIFEQLKRINPNFREKLVGISGDGTKLGLGISIEDRILLSNEVNNFENKKHAIHHYSSI